MGDPFKDAITALFDSVKGITGVGFTDLDGEDIAVTPRSARETIRTCAAYGGLALKRMAAAQERAGHGEVKSLDLVGSAGAFVTLAVGREYQLVVTMDQDTPAGQVAFEAQFAVESLAANI